MALQRLKDDLESQKEAQRACLEQQNRQALEQLREEMEAATQRERTFLSTEKEQALKQLQEQLEGERRGVSRCGGRAGGGGLHVDPTSQAGDAGRKRGVGVRSAGDVLVCSRDIGPGVPNRGALCLEAPLLSHLGSEGSGWPSRGKLIELLLVQEDMWPPLWLACFGPCPQGGIESSWQGPLHPFLIGGWPGGTGPDQGSPGLLVPGPGVGSSWLPSPQGKALHPT